MTTPAAGCGGDGCDSRDPWPLHHVRHRGVFCRLCTSCVLKYHAGAFCSGCFDVLDAPSPPDRPLVHCSRCPSASHIGCLADPGLAADFVCPNCENAAGFSYFRLVGGESEDGRRRVDLAAAKVLLAAARVAAASMSRAAVAARADAERKVKEAAVARKRARELLERALLVSKKQREEERKAKVSVVVPEVVEPKKKTPKSREHKRVNSREVEKWRRFQEPIPLGKRPFPGVVDSEKPKGSSVGVSVIQKVGGFASTLSNRVKLEEKEKKEAILGAQGGSVKEEEKVLLKEIPQSTQEVKVLRNNTGAIPISSRNAAS